MFLAVGALLHQLETFNASPTRRRVVTLLILGTLIPVSVYHCWADEIVVHEIAFAVMVIICGRDIRKLIRERVSSEESRKKLVHMANMGLGRSNLHLFHSRYALLPSLLFPHYCHHARIVI